MTASVGLVQPIDPTHDGEPHETDALRALPEPRARGVQQPLFACDDPAPPPSFTAIRARGDSGTVADTLNKFRAALGGSLNAPNTAPADSGRREINWDGVPVALTNIDTFPATFFNVNSKRGAVFSTPGTGLRVDSTAFASVNAGLADQFKAFSPKKLFVAVGSNQ